MKLSSFRQRRTAAVPGGSPLLDEVVDAIKAALDDLANRMLGNATEDGGVWTIAMGTKVPRGSPPVGSYYVWIDPTDNLLRARGANGTDTVMGVP